MQRKYLYYAALPLTAIAAFLLISRRRRRVQYIVNELPRAGSWERRELSEITDITVHHSATPSTATAESFARYHIQAKGWPGIGYHFVITSDGTIQQTNDIVSWSYHNGYNNRVAIGICLVGNFDTSYPTMEQVDSLLWLVNDLKRDTKLPKLRFLMGHKEYAGRTSCPGNNFNTQYFRTKTNLKKHGQTYGLNMGDAYNPSRADN